MDKLIELAVVGFSILIVMLIAWPFLKKGAQSDEELADRRKTLWQGGLICWIGAVVLVQVVGHLRQEKESIDRNNENRMQQINEQYRQQN
ncbi:ABC-type transport system involved in cytochrome bd biosynthesis fused ATPase/permease subunit [Pseudomonas frederiksbergensis]|uniref:hypothetical protein n=1 Tax=Pseudomonas TaxID=286 RepID=UPI003D245845